MIDVIAVDLAGNEQRTRLNRLVDGAEAAVSFELDNQPAAAPAEPADAPTLVYERAPWGSRDDFAPRFRFRAEPGSVESESMVILYDGPDPKTAVRLGYEQARADGSVPAKALSRADQKRIYALVVDHAGNAPAQATLVRDVSWTASFVGKLARSEGENPHVFENRAWFLPSLHQQGADEVDGHLIQDEADDEAASIRGAGRWQHASGVAARDGRFLHALAFDRARARVVMFGGESYDTDCDDSGTTICGLTEWDGHAWKSAPFLGEAAPLRGGHGMTWDAARGLTLIFGGKGGVGGCGNAGTSFCAAPTAPIDAREGAAWASLPDRGPILVGGATEHYTGMSQDRCTETYARQYLGESWSFDAETWNASGAALSSDPSPGPQARSDHAMAAIGPGRFMMFGGWRDCFTTFGETWLYDAVEGWSLQPSGVAPARHSAALAYHEALDQVVMFGGGTTFEWTSASGALAEAKAAGCRRCRCSDAGTYLWSEGAWSAADSDHEPLPRWDAAMAYDAGREAVLLTGGVTPDVCEGDVPTCGDLWEWSYAGWTPIEPADPEGDGNATARSEHTLIADKVRGELVMFGGGEVDGDGTWLWHGGADARPAQVARFDFGETGETDEEVRNVALTWKATVDSAEGDAAELLVWSRGAFVPAAELGFTADANGNWQSSELASIARLPYGPGRTLGFALQPASPNGTHHGHASVETDLVELRVDYRLPAE